MGAGEIPRVLGGYGINIVSTSRGLMSGKWRAAKTSAAKCWRKFINEMLDTRW
jgi:ribosomal protein S8